MRKIPPEVRKIFAEFGRIGGTKGGAKGGKTTAKRRTPEERQEAARKAVLARWKAYRKKKAQVKAHPSQPPH